jgi:hypothetical protein
MKPTTDKRSRLHVVAPYIKNGTVLFPRSGCEQLLEQIFNLGVKSHDDPCDGLTTLLQGLVSQGLELPKISGLRLRRLSSLSLQFKDRHDRAAVFWEPLHVVPGEVF